MVSRCLLLDAVHLLLQNGSTQDLGTVLLGIVHVHNAAMALAQRDKDVILTDKRKRCLERKLRSSTA